MHLLSVPFGMGGYKSQNTPLLMYSLGGILHVMRFSRKISKLLLDAFTPLGGSLFSAVFILTNAQGEEYCEVAGGCFLIMS